MAYLTLSCRKLTVNVPNLMNSGGGWVAMGGFATLGQLSQIFLFLLLLFCCLGSLCHWQCSIFLKGKTSISWFEEIHAIWGGCLNLFHLPDFQSQVKVHFAKPQEFATRKDMAAIDPWLFVQGEFTKPEDFNVYVTRDGTTGKPSCSVCKKFSNHSMSNVRNHIESKHFPNTFSYTCRECPAVFGTFNALNMHQRTHRKYV